MKPFPVGKPVTGSQMIGRGTMIKELINLLSCGQSTVLVAPRRYGKTSLFLEVLRRLNKSGYYTGEVDLFDAISPAELAQKIVTACLRNKKISVENLFKTIKSGVAAILKHVEFKQIIDDYEFVLKFSDSNISGEALLDEALDFIEKFAAKEKKEMIFAFDEFSELEAITGVGWFKKFRSKFQRHEHVTYLFAGSQESIMTELFSKKTKAFYRFARIFPVGNIDFDSFSHHIAASFKDLEIDISKGAIDSLLAITGGHPYYTQLLCQVLYLGIKGERDVVSMDDVRAAHDSAMQLELPRFDDMWEGFLNRKNFLSVIRSVALGNSPYSLTGMSRQNVNRILNSLVNEGCLMRLTPGEYKLKDSFFERYVREKGE